MQNTSRRDKFLPFLGAKIGLLTVGELVTDIRNHPLYFETRTSYLSHSRLWECHCECGNTKLYSDNILRQGETKSCGCLRNSKRQDAYVKKVREKEKKRHKQEIQFRIKMAQDRLYLLRSAPPALVNSQAIEDCGSELRKLFAMKAYASRKTIVEKEIQERTRKALLSKNIGTCGKETKQTPASSAKR